MKKKVFIVLISCFLAVACNPSKVTDPRDSKFDINEFSFMNYKTEQEFKDALVYLFPSGTERNKVEVLFLDKMKMVSGYTKGKSGNYYITYYVLNKKNKLPSYTAHKFFNRGLRMTQFEYDEHDSLVGMEVQILHGKSNPRFFQGTPVQKGMKL